MDRGFIIATLRFWDVFPDERKKDEAAKQLEADVRETIQNMDADTRDKFGEIARRQYAEQEATKASVAGRASTLLLFVGVISTGATLVASSLATTQPIVLGLIIFVGACLLYACLAVAFLAVRAQEVAMWVAPAIYPKDARNSRVIAVTDAVEHAVAYEQNKPGVRHLVAYLADAQRWARRAVILVVALAILSVFAAATKPIPATGGTAVPSATPAASVAPPQGQSPAPAATPMPSEAQPSA